MDSCAKNVGLFTKRYCEKAIVRNKVDEASVESFEIPHGILNETALIFQTETFTVCMVAYSSSTHSTSSTSELSMQQEVLVTVSSVWSKITDFNSSIERNKSLSKYLKLFELITGIPLGSIEYERIFSALSFVKSKKRNLLDEHLTDAL